MLFGKAYKVLKMLLLLFLKISDNCQESTTPGASFWIKIGLSVRPATMFIKN